MTKIDPAKVIAVIVRGRWFYGVTGFRIDNGMAYFTVNWRNGGQRDFAVALSEITGYEQAA